MKMQKSAVFRGAAASWTGHPTGRTLSSERIPLIQSSVLLNLSDARFVHIAVLNDSQKPFIQCQAVTVGHVFRNLWNFTLHQQFRWDRNDGSGHEFFLCARAAGQ